jgi:hypothetical protein
VGGRKNAISLAVSHHVTLIWRFGLAGVWQQLSLAV